jgi:hypothetical protein
MGHNLATEAQRHREKKTVKKDKRKEERALNLDPRMLVPSRVAFLISVALCLCG